MRRTLTAWAPAWTRASASPNTASVGQRSTISPRPSGAVFGLAEALVQAGAQAVSVRRIDYAFAAENPLVERLLGRV
jgi:ATP phosphoribosyltransferase